MPPEQGAGKKAKLGPASDVYGLGALLYYLLTARPPFVAETFEATLAQVFNTEPVAPRQLNPGIPLRPGDALPQVPGKGPGAAICLGERAGRRTGSISEGRAHSRPSDWPAGKAVALVPTQAGCGGDDAAVVSLIAATVVTVVAARSLRRLGASNSMLVSLRLNLYVADMNVAYQAVLNKQSRAVRKLISDLPARSPRQSRAGR